LHEITITDYFNKKSRDINQYPGFCDIPSCAIQTNVIANAKSSKTLQSLFLWRHPVMHHMWHYDLYCKLFNYGERGFYDALEQIVADFLGDDAAGRIVCSAAHQAVDGAPDQRHLMI
jgi:hypothetical protein